MYQNKKKKNWLVVGVLSNGQLEKISGPHTNTQVQSAHRQAKRSLNDETKCLDIPDSVTNVKVMREEEFAQQKQDHTSTRAKPVG